MFYKILLKILLLKDSNTSLTNQSKFSGARLEDILWRNEWCSRKVLYVLEKKLLFSFIHEEFFLFFSRTI